MIVVFLIFIPVLTIGTLLSTTTKNIFNEKYSAVALQSIMETGEKINYLLGDVEDYTTSILANRAFLELISTDKTSDKVIDEALRGFLASRNGIDGISLINSSGTYSIGTNKTTPLISIQQMTQEFNDSKPIWLSTKQQNIKILSGISSRYYFSVVRNIIDFNTLENYGTLVVDIEELQLAQAYENLYSNGGEVFIVDSEGAIVSHPDKAMIGQSILETPYAKQLLEQPAQSDEIYYTLNGEDQVAFYSVLDANNWRIIKTISTDALYFEINKLQWFFMLGGGIYAILMIVFLLSLSVQYTEPMLKIIHDLKRVEKGDLTVRTNANTNNEISQLSDSVNNMITEMEVLIDKLVQEERLKREVELEALHAQINPHFLYNTLNTIKWMAKIQGAHSVSNAIVALVKLLRISINISADFIPLKEELEYIQNYVVIQKLRFNEDFDITYDVSESDQDILIPKLILQPIIENSIIYGMEVSEGLKISVESSIETSVKTSEDAPVDSSQETALESSNGDTLVIKIIDNGPGIPEEVLSQITRDINAGNKFSKAGLNNVSQRIKLFCGDAYGLELLTTEGLGTTVVVRLPLKKAELLDK